MAAGPKTAWASDLVSVKFFTLLALPILSGSVQWIYFLRKCTVDTLPWSCLATGVLIPIVTDPRGIFEKFRNSNVLWYCHPRFVSYGLATGAFCLALLILSHHAKSFSKKIVQFSQGEMSNTSGGFSLCTITSTTWFLQSDDILGYGLLFQRPVCSTKALQHVCNGTAATTHCAGGGTVVSKYILKPCTSQIWKSQTSDA